jgi:hypothetical protein
VKDAPELPLPGQYRLTLYSAAIASSMTSRRYRKDGSTGYGGTRFDCWFYADAELAYQQLQYAGPRRPIWVL